MNDIQADIKLNQEYLESLYADLERRLKRYRADGISRKEQTRRLVHLRSRIIEVTARLEELRGSAI